MGKVPTIADAVLVADQGRILRFGPADQVDVPRGAAIVDARGGCVIPGLIDCHTHTVFAGSREHEFVQRLAGKSYAQLAEEGGGIKVTVEAVRRASVDELVGLALPRLRRMLTYGVTTLEIKSGYGLTAPDEIKMLEAIQRLKALTPIELVASYLAAHTVPKEFTGRAEAYLDAVLAPSVLRRITEEGLAEFADVFCERTAFDLEQSRRYLEACKAAGLTPRLHADQITPMGASKLAAAIGAASADHLETIDDEALAALRAAGTVAVLLPACSLYLGVAQAPARKIIDAGVPVAVATDFNPGSCMIESLPLALSIACTQMRLTPTEALVAATANAAAALRREDRLGAIAAGRQADLVVLDVPNHQRWLYEFGRNCATVVIKQGRVVYQQS
jgi:imidazolonepropionase